MNAFDRKFGKDFTQQLPQSPGVYRFVNDSSEVIYVGKAKNLKRRIDQYRNAKRRKKHRKMKVIVADAAQLEFQTCSSEADAELLETQLIQTLRPRWNIVGAFYFLYPLIGIKKEANEVSFCYTTQPELFSDFEFHGAFRSREITRNSYFSLMALLGWIGHQSKLSQHLLVPKFTYIRAFRQIPEEWFLSFRLFLKGESKKFLEDLSLELLENAGARRRSKAIQLELRQILSFWKHEIQPLHQARRLVSEHSYPVSQKERDVLFLKAKHQIKSRSSMVASPPHLSV